MDKYLIIVQAKNHAEGHQNYDSGFHLNRNSPLWIVSSVNLSTQIWQFKCWDGDSNQQEKD